MQSIYVNVNHGDIFVKSSGRKIFYKSFKEEIHCQHRLYKQIKFKKEKSTRSTTTRTCEFTFGLANYSQLYIDACFDVTLCF